MRLGNLTGFGSLLLGIVLTANSVAMAQASTNAAADAAIKERVEGFVKAYNSHNSDALSGYFTDDATLIDVEGAVIRGKTSIAAQFAEGFAQSSTYKLDSQIESIRYITPDVAQIEGSSSHTAPNEAPIINRFVSLVVKKDNVWKLAEIRDLPSSQDDISPADRLAELEWMIGEWVDQGGDLKIHSVVQWGENKAYLTRKTTISEGEEGSHSSLMVLAYDPQAGQIRSWLFDSAGGRGEATWIRVADDQWVLRAAGNLSNGLPNSATQVVTIVGKDALKTSSFDRIIGGEIAPDIDEIMMVRKAPAVGDKAAAPAANNPAAPAPGVPAKPAPAK
ncbi:MULTISPECIES: SgcJ/EcaC family oxidoreductase [unclassified Schlesneria]|uniref:YybH family protein n=1 Tax=Schlesneria TaxID=656899 RepID=UPI002EE244EA